MEFDSFKSCNRSNGVLLSVRFSTFVVVVVVDAVEVVVDAVEVVVDAVVVVVVTVVVVVDTVVVVVDTVVVVVDTVVVVIGAVVVDPVPIRTSPNDIICGRDEIIGVKINRMQTILILKFILKEIVLVKICFRKMKFI